MQLFSVKSGQEMHSDNHQKCNAAGCEPPCSYGYEWQESYKIFRSIFKKRKWMMKSAYIITWVNNNGDDEGRKEKF